MTQKTVLYLDVDGVINALGSAAQRFNAGWRDEWISQQVMGGGHLWPITHSVELVERINTLVATGVEVRWLTTWTTDAALNLGPAVGLTGSEEWRVVGADEHDRYRYADRWWKFEALLNIDGLDERIIWLDDDLVYDAAAMQWAHAREDRVLALAPNMHLGISRPQMERVEQFAVR